MASLVVALLLLLVHLGQASSSYSQSHCKCFPGDECWPSRKEWAHLNSTVGGRLIATVPLGAPCHNPVYDADVCAELQDEWLTPTIQ